MSRIQNNLMAMNTHRQYSINNANSAKAAEKLSSGFRINRAGDDAAGLAISEKMRAQVRGLNMASKNSQDAISLVQTAEGALQEVHSMLQRMNELAVQANTGTNETFDRQAISAEFEQLKAEIDDISNQTTFNNMNLLDGSMGAPSVSVNAGSTLKVGDTLKGGTADYIITANTGMSASKAGSFTIKTGTIDADGVFKADAAGASAGTDIQVSFTDAKTGDVTNTVIKADKAYTAADVAGGKQFTLDLSSAGLGKYEVTATAGATAADFVATLHDKTINVTPASGAAVTKTPATSPGNAQVVGATASFEFNLAGLTATGGVTDLVLNFGGTEVTLAGLTAGDNATTIGAAVAAAGPITIGGQAFTVTNNAGVLTFTSGEQKTLDVSGFTATVVSGGATALTSGAISNDTDGATVATAVKGTTTIGLDTSKLAEGDKITIGDKTYGITLKAGGTMAGVDATLDLSAGQSLTQLVAAINATGANVPTGLTITADGTTGIKAEQNAAGTGVTTIAFTSAAGDVAKGAGAATIQVGASQGETLDISIGKMDSEALGLKNLSIAAQGEGAGQAGEAITAVKAAINQVSEQRASLGAIQNRLEHKIANLDISAENLQAAESRIRDVDMAKEMTNFSKQNILSQAATAMLAQANSLPQNVLQLLR